MAKRILCRECKWCYLHLTGKTGDGTLTLHYAECRRHPPKEVWDCFAENNIGDYNLKRYDVQSFARFPQVSPEWWCGEAELETDEILE